ncbi:hypothetical protein NXW11_24600 [Bacteroides thetaiotaomicron]|uniref:hypothetical protein n=1 Tax=Bacteroides thetaiotaomicron TaxID=818 RepID=UPI002166093E|nr:hypothetical protein [Bacteroides thetaiotaomicron]MCS2621069.1 hypothetical protein [Bacteroides thetaiotaomicron]
MVSQWRNFFHNAEMPFYYAPDCSLEAEVNDKLDWAWFRQCQLELMKEVPGAGNGDHRRRRQRTLYTFTL